MKLLDIIICRIVPTTGMGECRDGYATDVGAPTLDTNFTIKGNSDVTVPTSPFIPLPPSPNFLLSTEYLRDPSQWIHDGILFEVGRYGRQVGQADCRGKSSTTSPPFICF